MVIYIPDKKRIAIAGTSRDIHHRGFTTIIVLCGSGFPEARHLFQHHGDLYTRPRNESRQQVPEVETFMSWIPYNHGLTAAGFHEAHLHLFPAPV